ncbi:hypothetical protein [Pseudoprimorskyibacter insulae]|uniref:4Fe-4S ferredoxin-type domain-containing protein n=1 Tax=Pseudoprimorskyibacter insulae TaxID=1695997 RepID=A0A2R8AZZ3_9RHOB|nr:hypothetical protein [Pseudoprimorskyibacter insulae]SPF81615.1 hypothetical protein PRI8871_03440 [Pseudoprimorskyibacter insulae]
MLTSDLGGLRRRAIGSDGCLGCTDCTGTCLELLELLYVPPQVLKPKGKPK